MKYTDYTDQRKHKSYFVTANIHEFQFQYNEIILSVTVCIIVRDFSFCFEKKLAIIL